MKKFALLVWIIISFLPLEADILSERISPGTRDYLAIRVEFQQDSTIYTTGDGKFMQTEWVGHDSAYALDALPHDRNYFKSHLTFLNNYWDMASGGLININTDNGNLLPLEEDPYVLSQTMRYYSDPDSLDYRLALLVYESVMMAIDSDEYKSSNDGLIIYHAGVGQDFKIDLDDSPFDIPSFYFDEPYLSEYLPADKYADLMSVHCTQGVVLPESQNQLDVDIALNGTEVLLTGMMLGLPTLYDTEFSRSGAGTYGLMDQGSNTGSGLFPIKPSAFERYLLGVVEPIEIKDSQKLTLLRDEVYKLPISSNEYFLLEFRKNTGAWADSILWYRDDIVDYLGVLRVMDSLDLVDYTFENGVLTYISDLDIGLPTSGLLIWHISEPDFFGENPNGESAPFLNLVEADGGDDIGKWYGTYDPSINNGWKWDMWFKGNEGYEENNPTSYKMQFNDSTHPDTRSNENLPTGINIRNFAFYSDSVVIQLVMDPPAAYNFSGVTFDEMTTALEDVLPDSKQVIGYKDSSLYLFDGTTLSEIYQQDTAYIKGKVALLTYENSLIQITNGATSAKVSHLINTGGLIHFDETNITMIDHLIDLEHVAIHGDSLLLPPKPSATELSILYSLDLTTWTLSNINSIASKAVIPYVMGNELYYMDASAVAVMDDTLIYAADHGFNYGGWYATIDEVGPLPVYAGEHKFNEIIPLHMDTDGRFEILALTEFNNRTTLSAFTHTGSLLNHFPIFENYQKLRVYYLGGEPQIVAYDPAGIIDVYSTDADMIYSLPAPVNATSLFMEQVSADTAWLVADGNVYTVRSDSVYWGYQGKDAAYSNAQHATQAKIPVVSDKLIRNGLIYNYPNPIENDRTKFRYFATGAQSATINIYQLSGAFVETLTKNSIDQQWNEIIWDVSDYESGVYIAKIDITDGETTETYFVKPAILK